MSKNDNGKRISIDIFQDRDPELFEYFSNGQTIKLLREKFQESEELKSKISTFEDYVLKQRSDLVGIKLSSRQAQKNTDMLLGIVNTYLFTQENLRPVSPQEKKHPLLAFFDTEHRNMLDDVAQRRVYSDKPKSQAGSPEQEKKDYQSPF
ncbi:MAG: hypothetical protein LBV19_05295 [Streptococcaceae bacterium]|jgi:hypothetical protein|nr:hypothetical protein [Streptococcaceae bacterium]